MNTTRKYNIHRDENGFLISLLFACTFCAVVVFACLSVDVVHNVSTQSQLQTAVDAASVAGADQLTSQPPTATQVQTATNYAVNVAGNNKADGITVTNSGNTSVNVVVDTSVTPAMVTVTATRNMNDIFSGMFGQKSSTVFATATAAAHQVPLGINPNQLNNIALSLDYIPTSGPQSGYSFNQSWAGQQFTICLNNTSGNCERNSSLINDWDGRCNNTLNVGSDNVTCTLGTDSDFDNLFTNINTGMVLSLPLTSGTPALQSTSQTTTCVGICGFKVSSVDCVNKRICGTIQNPVYISGRCGKMYTTGNSTNDDFMAKNAPWHCSLTNHCN